MISYPILFAVFAPLMFGLFGSKTSTPTDQLYRAVYKRDLAGAKAALESGANVNGSKPERGDYGYKENTPLALACTTKNIEMMKLLIKAGADVNARNGEQTGITALEMVVALSAEEQMPGAKSEAQESSASTRLAAVKLLLDNGADPKRTSRLGGSALAVAAGNGSLEIVELLISKGAPVVGTGILDQPMLEAAKLRKPVSGRIMEVLIAHKANINLVYDPNRECALHLAAGCGNIDVVRVLLDHGAKTQTTDRFGSTPLHRAVVGNHVEVAKLLLQHGASKKAEDVEGRTPLMRAKSEAMKEALK